MAALHQTRLDAELESQRQSLEDLKTEVSLLRKSSFDTGRMSCDTSSDTASTVASASQSGWCPQKMLVRGGRGVRLYTEHMSHAFSHAHNLSGSVVR